MKILLIHLFTVILPIENTNALIFSNSKLKKQKIMTITVLSKFLLSSLNLDLGNIEYLVLSI